MSKRDVPDYATWFVFIIAMLLLVVSGERWIEALMTTAAIAAGVIYIFIPLASIVLRKTRPDWPRPYRMLGGIGMAILATIFGLTILVATVMGTTAIGWTVLGIFLGIGVIIFVWMLYKQATDETYRSITALSPEDIPADRL